MRLSQSLLVLSPSSNRGDRTSSTKEPTLIYFSDNEAKLVKPYVEIGDGQGGEICCSGEWIRTFVGWLLHEIS